MKAFDAQWLQLKRQLDASPWLKWAGLAIALLLTLFGLQALDDWRVSRQKAGIEAELNLRRILALKGQDVWLAREKAALQLRDSLRAQLPQVSTPGMAQAMLQSWLRDISSGFGEKQNVTLRVNRSAPLENMPDVIRVNASLNAALTPRQALTLLRQIESAPNLVVVETLNMQSDSSSTVHLTLNAYYRVGGAKAP